jgi:hypothetical protein
MSPAPLGVRVWLATSATDMRRCVTGTGPESLPEIAGVAVYSDYVSKGDVDAEQFAEREGILV